MANVNLKSARVARINAVKSRGSKWELVSTFVNHEFTCACGGTGKNGCIIRNEKGENFSVGAGCAAHFGINVEFKRKQVPAAPLTDAQLKSLVTK